MKNFTKHILLVSLSVFISSSLLQAQQSGITKGNVTIQDVKLTKAQEISREVAMPKNGEVYIENSSRNIVIKTWDQPKVKIVTTVQYEGDGNYTQEEWFEKANLSLKTLGSSVKIKAGIVNNLSPYGTTLYSTGTNNLTEVVVTGQPMSSTKSQKKLITVYLPAGSKIDIESKYSEITLPANIGDANIDISNGNLDAENLGKLILRSKYAIVNIGDVKNAEIEFTGGRLTAKNIDELDIDSKYSTIEMALAKKAVIRSTNDEYEFEEIGELSGHKNYGNFRITKLMQKIELEGVNADIKVRNIAPTASLVKINDKYADIRMPIKNTKNYTVDFLGAYSSVYGNFEKKSLPVTDKDMASLGLAAGYSVDTAGNITKRILVEGKPIYTVGNSNKTSITSLGNLTALTVAGSIPANFISVNDLPVNPNPVHLAGTSGTIQGGTFSGTLSARTLNQIVSGANNENITVSGYGTAKRDTVNVSGARSSSLTYVNAGNPSVTSTVVANNLTVAGYITATSVPMTGQNSITVNGSRTQNAYRTPTETIMGGTSTPFNRAYAYTTENDTPPKFSAIVGDGKGLKIELKCANCTVDFK